MRGKFLTLEGPEGSGKSTHARNLADRLRALGYDVVVTREPGGTKLGEVIRNVLQHDNVGESMAPEAEALLFVACRAQLISEVIEPALKKGQWVICDRFMDSTVAYQGYARRLGPERIDTLNQFAIAGTEPDLTFLLDLDVKRGFDRIKKRNSANGASHDRFERERLKFHQAVRKGYKAIARKSRRRIVVIDAAGSVEAVNSDMWAGLVSRIKELRVRVQKSRGAR